MSKNSIRFLLNKHCLSMIAAIYVFSGCTAYKSIPYFPNAETDEILPTYSHEPKIMPNDILSITVNSIIPDAADDFNLPLVPSTGYNPVQKNLNQGNSLQNYMVDKDGNINFPVLGPIRVAGMTLQKAQFYIASLIYPKYIAEEPIVNIRFLNFRVSVHGEVARAGTYTSENGQMSILDALAAAGDMTVYGRRDNVLLIRTDEHGETSFHRINLQDKQIIQNHELFFLQQNDKIYVEPNKAKSNNSAYGTEQSLGLTAISVGLSAISLIIVILKSI